MKRLWLLFAVFAAGLLLVRPLAAQEEEAMPEDEMQQEEEGMQEEEEEAPQQPTGLTMQMPNGWSFTFAGNVNAFYVYTDGRADEDEDVADPGTVVGGLVPVEEVSRIRTGLLPAFAVFEAKGQEMGVDLGVHFGFAPQIQTAGVHDNFVTTPAGGLLFGAAIDMRQVYLTFGGPWGQVLAGREIGLYQRQNILTDMTLFGVGSSGGGVGAAGTTLGRIGFGYIYPNFNAQITYSTPAGRPFQLSLGVFDPSFINAEGDLTYNITKTPRLETELTFNQAFGEANSFFFWAGGLYQNAELTLEDPTEDDEGAEDVNGLGAHGGIRLNIAGLSLVGSGYYGEGLGSTLMFTTDLGVDALGEERTSWGFIGQATYTPPGSMWTLGASYGDSRLDQTENDELVGNDSLLESNRSIVGTVVYQATTALKVVFEYTHTEAESHANTTFKSDQGAGGLMLFF